MPSQSGHTMSNIALHYTVTAIANNKFIKERGKIVFLYNLGDRNFQ